MNKISDRIYRDKQGMIKINLKGDFLLIIIKSQVMGLNS